VSTFLNNKLSFVISTSIYISNDLKEKYSLGYKLNCFPTFQIHQMHSLISFNALAPKISEEETIECYRNNCLKKKIK